MAITAKGIKLEDAKAEYKEQRGNKRDLITLQIGKCEEEGSVGHRLDIDTPYRFISIFGPIYSIGNVLKYLSYEDAKISWVSNELRNSDYAFMKRNRKKRSVPNFWNIITLIMCDRLLADKELLNTIDCEYPGDLIDKVRIMPMVKAKQGLLSKAVFDKKLNVYGIILGVHLRLIINEFRAMFHDKGIMDTNHNEFKAFKLYVKNIIITKIFDNLKHDNFLEGLDNNITEEEVKIAFMGKENV